MRALAFAVIPLLLAACGERLMFAPVEGVVHHEPDARYEALFPRYVELCAVTQFRPKQKSHGGSPGHATMYLKGACRDGEAPYPKLRRCARVATDAADPEHGAGVSVNRWFRSVNWVAFSGRRLFYDGDLEPGQRVTAESRDAAIRHAVDDGSFRGVELWPWPDAAPGATLEDFVRRWSAGTDFALQMARSALCGRVPVEEEMMDEIIHFLNDLNREYATGAADYRWNGLNDNCVHTLRNALAAASVWEPITASRAKLLALFNLAVPANEALNLALLGTSGPVDSYPEIFGDDPMRNAMLEFDWLPTRHGALLVSLPAHADNEIFDPQPRLLVLQSPLARRSTRRLLRMLEDPRYTDLDTNLSHFQALYAEILARKDERDTLAAVRGDRYRRVRRRYDAVIEAARQDVERLQRELAAAP